MSLIYRVMYLVGFTPWDTGQVPGELSALMQGSGALPTPADATALAAPGG